MIFLFICHVFLAHGQQWVETQIFLKDTVVRAYYAEVIKDYIKANRLSYHSKSDVRRILAKYEEAATAAGC